MSEHDLNAWSAGLERGLARFADLIGESSELEREFVRSQGAFAASGAPPLLAERRHLEWFVCERPSDVLEGVPADVLSAPWLERSLLDEENGADAPLLEAMLGSLASAFEIVAVESDGSLLARDLFGLGEHELAEPEFAEVLAPGDLLVGRIFPVEGELHRLSPAVGCFRDRALVSALHADVERMRAGRAHVLRIQQSELEALFFQRERLPGAGDEDTAGESDLPAAAEAARQALAGAGLDAADADGAIDALLEHARESRSAGIVTELLNALAFETDVDLQVAQRALVELWGAVARGPRAAPRSPLSGGETAERPVSTSPAEALRRFDEGRAKGEDLEQLFRRLELELGVAGDEDEDSEQSPDFPGVVGAMLEEWVWDRERERGRVGSGERLLVRELSRYAAPIGVFENLGARELLDFSARWLLDESSITTESEARAFFAALEDFCRWSEEGHAHALWSAYEPYARALTDAVVRLVPLRASLAADVQPEPTAYRLRDLSAGEALLVADDGHERRVRVDGELRARLRPGDRIRLARGVVCRVYPGVLEELVAALREPAD